MEVKDELYSFEIARRSVSRAAVHLGIDNMTEAALDVMADILLTYLSRTGKAMAHLVEASGRTSAHTNVLDAFQACQVMASPAVGRLHLRDPDVATFAAVTGGNGPGMGGSALATNTSSLSSSSSLSAYEVTGWKGLAAFLFGPKWLDEKVDMNDNDAMGGGNRQPGGGKVGPATWTTREGDLSVLDGDETGGPNEKLGWQAPYLEEIPAFPRASDKCANPHALPRRVGQSLHRKVRIEKKEVVEEEEMIETLLASIPDETFTDMGGLPLGYVWGETKKRKHGKVGDDGETDADMSADEGGATILSSPPNKRVKLNDGSVAVKKKEADASTKIDGGDTEGGTNFTSHGEPSSVDLSSGDLSYIPTFYPGPPPTQIPPEHGRVVVDVQGQQKLSEELQEQHLQHQLNPSAGGVLMEDGTGSQEVRSSLVQLSQYWGSGWDESVPTQKGSGATVPMGRTGTVNSGPADDPIIPMNKPSGSRVSRILEGSMDAAAMQ
jgi:hypothetical protein